MQRRDGPDRATPHYLKRRDKMASVKDFADKAEATAFVTNFVGDLVLASRDFEGTDSKDALEAATLTGELFQAVLRSAGLQVGFIPGRKPEGGERAFSFTVTDDGEVVPAPESEDTAEAEASEPAEA
jgi:hypothetical protein